MRRVVFRGCLCLVLALSLSVLGASCGGGSSTGTTTPPPTGTGTSTDPGGAEALSIVLHIKPDLSASEWSAFESRLQQGSKCLWEATEGQMYLGTITAADKSEIAGCNWFIDQKGVLCDVPGGTNQTIAGWYMPDYTDGNNPNKDNERIGTGTEFPYSAFVHEISHWKLQQPMPFEAYDCNINTKMCVRSRADPAFTQRYLFCDGSNSKDCKNKCSEGSSWGHMLAMKTGWKHPNSFAPSPPSCVVNKTDN